jgi:hypothetical protein
MIPDFRVWHFATLRAMSAFEAEADIAEAHCRRMPSL